MSEIPINIGSVSVMVSPQERRLLIHTGLVNNTEFNLRVAREKNIKPISVREILDQITPEDFSNSFLFDTPGITAFLSGNLWRVTAINSDKESATLQLCTRFTNTDVKIMPPVTVPLDEPLFTGIFIEKFTLGELPASLREVVNVLNEVVEEGSDYPETLKHKGETVLWSNQEGELVTVDNHPGLE